jgi:hypothetical protein
MAFLDPEFLLAKAVKFFVTDDFAVYGLLQSSLFVAWVLATSPMRGERLAFSTRNSLDTFVPPPNLSTLRKPSEQLWRTRLEVMESRNCGLTDLMNRVHDPDDHGGDALALRHIQQEVTLRSVAAYDWDDLSAEHDFYETAQGIRFTLPPDIRTEFLSRMLDLNLQESSARTSDQRLPHPGAT